VLGLWLEARQYRHDPLWSDEYDRANDQIGAMLGMLIVMPAVLVITLIDSMTPANFNLSVLFTVPLVACAWARSVRLLWTMFVLLQVLTFGGLLWGPPPSDPSVIHWIWLNRIMNSVMMLILAGLLHYVMRTRENADQSPPLDDPPENGSRSGNGEHLVAL
jgi:hypothetical protein